jgi:hypothetical protein
MSASPNKEFVRSTDESISSQAALRADDSTRAKNPPAEDTIRSIKKFLQDNASSHRKDRKCNTCGGSLGFLNAYGWLDGAEVASTIQLPFCPKCNPDVLTALRRRGAQRNGDCLD